eukprot:s4446_g8.t1
MLDLHCHGVLAFRMPDNGIIRRPRQRKGERVRAERYYNTERPQQQQLLQQSAPAAAATAAVGSLQQQQDARNTLGAFLQQQQEERLHSNDSCSSSSARNTLGFVMSAALLKQVRAAQKFLGSIRHLPSFKEAKEKQAELLSKKFASLSVPVEAAAELDYVAIPQYLTASLWKSLSEDRRDIALEKLCRHCQLLGLSNASETTQGMILCLVFDLEGKLLGTQQWSVTLKEKGKVQKFLKQPRQSPFLVTLPTSVEECPPELLTRACRDETPLECPVSYEDLLARARDWPMRSTHRFAQQQLQLPVAVVPGHDEGAFMAKMGHFMAGFVQGQPAQESVSLPGLKIFPRAAKEAKTTAAAAVPVLALEDKKVENEAQVDQAPVVAQLQEELKPSGAVAATLDALKGETKNDSKAQAKAKSKGKKTDVMKRPAAKPKKRANMKRPAAAEHVHSSEEESREAKRLRLINAWVPKEMQKKYRNGCSKCYYRAGCTPSCWRLRGFAMTD